MIKGKEIEVIDQRSFHDGRLNAVNISYSGETFWLINIYAPNALKLRKTFFETCFQFLEEHVLPSEGVILGGDFNTVMNFKYDKMGGVMKDFQDAIHLRVQSASNDLIDIWREQHLNDSEFTHEQRYKSQIIRTRIDFFLVSSWMKDNVIESKILGRFISDHNPIMLRIEFKQAKKGKGLWKLNNSLLQDQNYCQQVIARIDNLK